MLLYFTSGTTGMPKMVAHDFYYPLGHIVTALYWQQCIDGGLHLTISETGWAKSVWGKLYGQWLCGSAVFVYEFERFVAKDILQQLDEHKVTIVLRPADHVPLHAAGGFRQVTICRRLSIIPSRANP